MEVLSLRVVYTQHEQKTLQAQHSTLKFRASCWQDHSTMLHV